MADAAAGKRVEDRFREGWGWMALRGLAGVAFGVVTLAWPGMTLFALIVAYASFTLIDGVSSLVFAARGGTTESGKSWPLIFTGVLGVAAGTIRGWSAHRWISSAARSGARGVTEIAAYASLRKEMDFAWLVLLSGVFSLVFGVILLTSPVRGILALLWVVGIYGLVAGGTLLVWAFAMRREQRAERETPGGPPPSEPTPA